MTACAIATQLGKGRKFPTVEIDWLNAEVLSSTMFEVNPIPKLEIYKCHSSESIENLKHKYKIDQKIKIKIGKFKQEIEQVYPE